MILKIIAPMGIKINTSKVIQEAERKKTAEKPLPVVIINGKRPEVPKPVVAPAAPAPVPPKPAAPKPAGHIFKDEIVKDLWDQMATLKKERAKLSTHTAFLVEQIEQRMEKEGASVLKAFRDGDITDPEIKQHYITIQNMTDEASVLWDKIKYVEQYGQLPVNEPGTSNQAPMVLEDANVSVLQRELVSLRETICKTQKKLDIGKAKNPLRISQWQEKLAMAIARREDVRIKIKKLQYDAREQRTGGA